MTALPFKGLTLAWRDRAIHGKNGNGKKQLKKGNGKLGNENIEQRENAA